MCNSNDFHKEKNIDYKQTVIQRVGSIIYFCHSFGKRIQAFVK